MPERLFHIVWGVLDGETHKTRKAPMYTARRAAMGAALKAAKEYERAGEQAAAVMCHEIVTAFLEAPVGDLLYGLTIEFQVSQGVYFIAVVPEGGDYKANKHSERRWAGSPAIRRVPPISSAPTDYRPPRPPVPVDDVAQRAGAAMARAARRAVEG